MRQPIFGPGRQHGLLLGRSDAGDAPAVNNEVERGSRESKGERQHDRPGEPMRRVAEGNAGKRRHDAELRDDDPAASPAQGASE
jgi:hypothetical protein